MRRLTVSQRQAILKWGCLTLSVIMLFGAFAAVPYIASAIPRLSGVSARSLLYGEEAIGDSVPTFALGAGEHESLTAEDTVGEYEPEAPIPTPTPGEYD